MGCCGQGGSEQISARRLTSFSSVKWVKSGPNRIVGTVTHTVYRFPGYGSVAAVDNRDLADILKLPGIKPTS